MEPKLREWGWIGAFNRHETQDG